MDGVNVPTQIGKYQVVDFLGQGAMGVVYRGRDAALDREVAIKVMSSAAGMDSDARTRFKREAQAAARLQHTNIVTIYELGEHNGVPFMAMELLEGIDLQRAIEGGLRPDARVTLPIILQVLAGLGHAHEHGVIHRDIKPSNIFLPRGRPAKIMDFGVARLAGSATSSGLVVGTPNYMSPEQVRVSNVDGRSDLFSAGLILYELVTGERAYQGDTIVALLFKIAHEAPNLTLLPKDTEWASFRRVMARALAHKAEERYPDARSMATDLTRALIELGGSPDWASASDRGVILRHTPRTPRPTLAASTPPQPALTPSAPDSETSPTADIPVPTALAARPATRQQVAAPAQTPSPVGSGQRMGLIVALVALGVFSLIVFILAAVLIFRSQRPGAATTTPSPPIASRTPVPERRAPSPTTFPVPTVQASQASPMPSMSPTSITATPAPSASIPTTEKTPAVAIANPRLERANDLYEKGKYQAALNEARALLAREPGNEEARQLVEDAEAAIVVEKHLQAAKAAMRKGNNDLALEEVRAGLAVAPSDGRLLALFKELTK
ncbi:MAG: protein kinase [Vicinamibacteria bacterium]|jgi:serine/threonine-protein kinase|nr:protein kinase [Vicinamibacteria bacterium]